MIADSEILKQARARARPCYRLALEAVDARACLEQARDRQVVEGTWLGGALLRARRPPSCPDCDAPLALTAQIDTSVVKVASIWSLYLCESCLDTSSPRSEGGYALIHQSASELLEGQSRMRLDDYGPQSKLIEGAWRLVGQPGHSFPSVEDFFDEVFDVCPTEEQEDLYSETVISIDAEATLASNGCFIGERRFQIGGYAELVNNMRGNRDCRVCGQEEFLLLAAPNVPKIFPSWLDNYVLGAWACLDHPEQNSMILICSKFG